MRGTVWSSHLWGPTVPGMHDGKPPLLSLCRGPAHLVISVSLAQHLSLLA